MTARVAAGLLVSALIRAVEAAGGHAMVLARGDAVSGAILIVTEDRGRSTGLYERVLGVGDHYSWQPAGPREADDPMVQRDYLARRRRTDPDLWVVEVDHPAGLALAEGMIAAG